MPTTAPQPHDTVHPRVGFHSTGETRTTSVVAYLSVYRATRHYGGSEEGGWWYDAMEHTGASYPFSAEQDYEAAEAAEDETEWYCEETRRNLRWAPEGLPRVTDEPTRFRVADARAHFVELFGDPDTQRSRYSARGGEDYVFLYELVAGAAQTMGRPRYE